MSLSESNLQSSDRKRKDLDVGFPSICCEYVLLPLVNKEADLAYGRKNVAGWEK